MKEYITLACQYQGTLPEASGLEKYPKGWICPSRHFKKQACTCSIWAKSPVSSGKQMTILLSHVDKILLGFHWSFFSHYTSWETIPEPHCFLMFTKPFFSLLLFVSSPSESSSNSHSLQEMPCLRGLAFAFLQAVSFSHRLMERLSLEKWPWSVSRQLLNICKNRDSTTFLAICATSWSSSQQKKKVFPAVQEPPVFQLVPTASCLATEHHWK